MKKNEELFVQEHKDKSYEELVSVRDQIFAEIRDFETEHEKDPEDVLDYPLTDGEYYNRLNNLGEICKLIAGKYGEICVQATE